MTPLTLTIDGDACTSRMLTMEDLKSLAQDDQAVDTSTWDAKRTGQGVLLDALLDAASARPSARYLTLHASRDDFHATLPLDAVRGRACIIYAVEGKPLPADRGGPFRFLIRDYAACKTDEIDDCANVKFVDRLEISASPGQDNRPRDQAEHAALHRGQA